MGLEDVPSAEELDEYRAAARVWLRQHMPPIAEAIAPMEQSKERLKDLMRRLYDGGYSGICFPTELGGQGLSRFHHRAFCDEASDYEMPVFVGNPGLSIIAPPIMEFGTPSQKAHVTAMLTGEETWVQMMSEPSGGSDMAGARTTAERDGETWILNGSKIWSSGAWRADWGLILVRTDWSVPKHRGLSLFLLDLTLPGITVNTIKMTDGTDEFCQEYFDNVPLPHDCLLGQPNDGWTVASRLLFHERDAVGGGSPYAFHRRSAGRDTGRSHDLVDMAERIGVADDGRVRELIGEAHALDAVSRQLIERVTQGIHTGHFPAIAGSLLRLNIGTSNVRRHDIALAVAGSTGVTWDDGDKHKSPGEAFISRQALCIGGGTNEMQRNLISERVLGMPREYSVDKDKPYNEVRTGPSAG